MSGTATERYRQHAVWEVIALKREALKTARYSSAEMERWRQELIGALEQATRSKDNPVPFLYDDVLDSLRDTLNQLAGDENSFSNFISRYAGSARTYLRELPGPPPRQVNDKYLAVLDSAIAAREDELSELRSAAAELDAAVKSRKGELAKLSARVEGQDKRIAEAAATIHQVTSTAAEQLQGEWNNKLGAWEAEREGTDTQLDQQLTDHISLLASAAAVGRRLVEHAAGQLTATEWTRRASRERKNAMWLRWGSIAAFFGALVTGGYILWHAIEKGFELTVGDGILRGALVLALVGVGSFLTAEARRHFKEADSAEEVALALTAIEPFYAGSSDEERSAAREAVGDTVFVRNVLSRFSARDAAKHAAVSNSQLSEIVDLLSKSADVVKKTGAAN